MTDPSTNGRASKDAYLQWRERLAEKHAVRREPDEGRPATPSSQWDPERLFAGPVASDPEPSEDEVTDLLPEPAPADEPTIDLCALEAVVPAEPAERPAEPPAPSRGSSPGSVIDVRSARPRVEVAAAPTRSDGRREQYDSVMERLKRAPQPEPDETPIADALRDLNERRLDGKITDAEFRARKAEIFERSARR